MAAMTRKRANSSVEYRNLHMFCSVVLLSSVVLLLLQQEYIFHPMCTVMVTSLYYHVAFSNNVAFSNFKKRKNLQKRRPLNKTDVPVYGKAIEVVPEHMC